jgi:zinc protease
VSRASSSLALLLSLSARAAWAEPPPVKPPLTAPAPRPETTGAAQGKSTPQRADEDPWAGRTDLFIAPAIKLDTKVTLGAIDRATLANGLQLIVVPRHQVPSVELTLAIRLPENADPLDKTGLAQFVADMLRKGTHKRSADQISEAIDFVGGQLGASAIDEGILISCHARARELGLCLELLADVVMNPTFPESELPEVKQQLQATINQAKDDANRLAQWHAANVFYGDEDPRGRPMSQRSLDAIDREALVKFHERWFAPNNAILAVSGDVDPKAARKAIDRELGAWKRHEVPPVTEPPARPLPTSPKGLPARLVDKPDATQSSLLVLGTGIKHADPDLYAVRLMNYTLGGGAFSSRLMRVVRAEGGKTYVIRSSFEAGREAGPFSVATFTRNAETAATLKLVLEQIDKMKASGPTAEELQLAKDNLIGGYGLNLETGADLAANLIGAELDGLDPRFVELYPARLDAVTLAQAAEAAKRHLDPRALVVVGKSAEVGPLLKKGGVGRIEVVNYLDPVSTADRRAIQAKRSAEAQVLPIEATEGKRLLDLAIAAAGGQALAKVQTLDMQGKGELSSLGQRMNVSFELRQVRDQSLREDIDMGGMRLSSVFSGDKGILRQGDRVMAMPPEAADEKRKALFRDPNFILLHATQPNARVRGLKPVSDGGTTYDILEVLSPENDVTRLWLDQKTHLITRLTFTSDGKEVRDEFSDYRPVQGVMFAFKTRHNAGTELVEIAFDKIEVNVKLSPDLFK